MEIGNGGLRPAVAVQFATPTDRGRVIVGVQVGKRGSDQGQTTPILAEVE